MPKTIKVKICMDNIRPYSLYPNNEHHTTEISQELFDEYTNANKIFYEIQNKIHNIYQKILHDAPFA